MSLIFNNVEPLTIIYNDTELDTVIYNGVEVYNKEPFDGNYLCFTALYPNLVVHVYLYNTPANTKYLEYSTDKINWTSVAITTSGELAAITLVNLGDKVYFRGTNHTLADKSVNENPSYIKFILGSVDISGSVNSLLSYEYNIKSLYGRNYCFYKLFSDMYNSITIDNLLLPATTLAPYCYNGMFYHIYNLKSVPSDLLPATTLAESCYGTMFYDCASLVNAPALPATTLADNCYMHMFSGCTSLTTPPALPATTLAGACYAYMFLRCNSLTNAPALPATTLVINCYSNMFFLSGIISIPSLPATTLAYLCYSQMFSFCNNIKMSETQTSEYQNAYRIPTTGTGTTAYHTTYYMFSNTGGTFTGTPDINKVYYTSNTII